MRFGPALVTGRTGLTRHPRTTRNVGVSNGWKQRKARWRTPRCSHDVPLLQLRGVLRRLLRRALRPGIFVEGAAARRPAEPAAAGGRKTDTGEPYAQCVEDARVLLA